MVKITSDATATAFGESANFMPLSINHCALERVRLYPVTVCPFSSRRATRLPPITPRPMNPSLAIQSFPPLTVFGPQTISYPTRTNPRALAGDEHAWQLAPLQDRVFRSSPECICDGTGPAPVLHPHQKCGSVAHATVPQSNPGARGLAGSQRLPPTPDGSRDPLPRKRPGNANCDP